MRLLKVWKRGNKTDISQYIHILQCPTTQEPLHVNTDNSMLVNDSGTIGYPLIDGVPDFWPDSAIKLITADNKV